MNMANVLVLLADGCEEIESATVIDVLRRADLNVCTASIGDRLEVNASRSMVFVADSLLAPCLDKEWDLIVLPGGMPGAEHLSQCDELITLLKTQLNSDRLVAAICAAPAVVLGRNNLLENRVATGYPSFMPELDQCVLSRSDQDVVVDDNLITSRGPGTAMAWSLTLVALLCGKEKVKELAEALLVVSPV
ncbi:DJ-1 family glyoxalase III [Agaribacterium sp. ZY112]|uniref:DJ-1 family glyoxalase III n=1 Tax=Agaribacterium sp. ZY112 TaxID=3233574 RepID=UPI003523C985